MSNPVIQTSFNAGEWAPALNARVDLQKYHQGAALLRNFFVDYRGGATTRPGTKYILQCFKGGAQVRLIPFQASFTVSYILEFGHQYIRFFNNGIPVVEAADAITGITLGGANVVITVANTYTSGDWILINSIVGTTQLNTNYYYVLSATSSTVTIVNLNGNSINQALLSPYVSGGITQRVYTLPSPYIASDVIGIKYAQNVNTLTLCHPNHPPAILTLITATNWNISAITFGTNVAAPTSVGILSTSLSGGTVTYGYSVTSVDINGQESAPAFVQASSLQDMRTTPGSITVDWVAAAGAVSYNVYKAVPTYTVAIQVGVNYGFVGNVIGTAFTDNNTTPDFTQTPPVVQNPFSGSGVAAINLITGGSWSFVLPTVTIAAPPAGGVQATAGCAVGTTGVTLAGGGSSFQLGEIVNFVSGIVISVTSLGPGGTIASFTLLQNGRITAGAIPNNPISETGSNGVGFGATVYATSWTITSLFIISGGAGYVTAPAVTFSGFGFGGASASTTLGASSSGNPTVPGFFQQRLVLAGPVSSPQQFNMSQPGSYYNFNTTDPIQDDNAIQGTLVSNSLNTIKSMVGMPTGLIMLSDRQAWLLNGGSPGAPIGATSITANSQSYNGASDLPLITANYDILYVQSKGSIVRDLAFNFYTSVYTGADISILSSHLFYTYTIKEWAWAEEPFKVVWAVRDDGIMLSLTFLKEQELIAWAHSDTSGLFQSVATVTETVASGSVDAVYVIVQRTILGQQVQYIERLTELYYPFGYKSSWQVDAGIQYSGTPATNFSGAIHLAGQTCTGVADGVIVNFTMSNDGTFTLGTPASLVTVGLAFTPQLQTLRLDLGEPTAQGKRKKINAVTVRCKQALGLLIGNTFSTLVAMKDLVLGNVGTMSNTIVTDLVTEDARTIIDPNWTVQGQVCIQQNSPYPATILGVIPEIEVGDTQK